MNHDHVSKLITTKGNHEDLPGLCEFLRGLTEEEVCVEPIGKAVKLTATANAWADMGLLYEGEKLMPTPPDVTEEPGFFYRLWLENPPAREEQAQGGARLYVTAPFSRAPEALETIQHKLENAGMSVTDTFIPSTAGGKFGFLNVDAEWPQVRAAINGAGCRNPDQAWVVLRIGKATVMLARPRPARAPRPRDRERGDTSSRADTTTSSTSSSRAVPSGTQSPQTATNQSKTQSIKTSEKEQLVARIQEELAKKFSQHVQDLQRRMENVENENRKKDQELQKLRDELAKERQEKEKARKEAEVARKTIEQLKAQRDAPQASGSSTAKAGAQAKAAPAAKALPAKPFATKAAPKTIQKKPGKYADHPTSAPPPKTLDIHEQAARDAGCYFPPEERESSAESASRSMSDYESEEPAKNSRPRSNSDADENNVGGKRAAVLGSELPGSQ